MASNRLRNYPLTPLTYVTQAVAKVARARTEQDVVEALRSTARSLVGCDGIAVIRAEGDLCHYVEEDAIGPLWKGQKFPQVACVSGWAMIHRQTVVIPDIAKDDRIPFELYEGTFVRSMMMAPIHSSDSVGSIGAYWSQPYTPTTWEIEILEALASAAATAFETIWALDTLATARASGGLAAEMTDMEAAFRRDVDRVRGIAVVPDILDVALRMTGMGFAAVARVTDDRWIACQVLDHVGFGLTPGSELPVESTLCNEIRDHREPVVFDNATEDDRYRDHHTPRIYGLKSYISVPIILSGGRFWGTLCAIDPKPAKVNNPQVLGAFKLFAELIAHHLDADRQLKETRALLASEQEMAELREQFVAVLGHDLRNPIAALDAGTQRLLTHGWTEKAPIVLRLMKASLTHMSALVDNVLDLARTRLGEGMVVTLAETDIHATLSHVVDELREAHPERRISVDFELPARLSADHHKIAQMFSNLVANAIAHGAVDEPVRITGQVCGGHLEVAVVNGGQAISADRLKTIFMPFQRGRLQAGSQGLGLGLFIASEIAKAHGGVIDVRSHDIETCFTFRMPISSVRPARGPTAGV